MVGYLFTLLELYERGRKKKKKEKKRETLFPYFRIFKKNYAIVKGDNRIKEKMEYNIIDTIVESLSSYVLVKRFFKRVTCTLFNSLSIVFFFITIFLTVCLQRTLSKYLLRKRKANKKIKRKETKTYIKFAKRQSTQVPSRI